MHAKRYVVPSLIVAGLLSSCGSGSPDSSGASDAPVPSAPATTGGSASAATGAGVITIKSFAFSAATVAPGAKVTVDNEDDAQHTVTADDGPSFDVAVGGGTSTTAFDAPAEAGTYPFHCNIHSSMKGTLVVTG